MRGILSSMLLGVLLVGSLDAQETTGERAEEVRKEIVKIELEKPMTGSEAADWVDRNSVADVVNTYSDGSTPTKTEQIAALRSKKVHAITNNEYGQRVYVYDNGTVAVCTYRQNATFERDGKLVSVHNLGTDVWVKVKDGEWRRIVHNVHSAPKQ
jgi:hypothetical protein